MVPFERALVTSHRPFIHSNFSSILTRFRDIAGFQIFYAYSKTFRTLIYKAHRVVIFAIAQLSCLFLFYYSYSAYANYFRFDMRDVMHNVTEHIIKRRDVIGYNKNEKAVLLQT